MPGEKPTLTTEAAIENLPSLFSRLADQVTRLFEAQLELLRVELKEELATYLRGTALILAGAVVALIGFVLLNVALALGLSFLFQSTELSQPARYTLGFVIGGLLYLIAGVVLALKAKQQIAKQSLIPPRTAKELERDKEWLEKEL